MICNTNVYFCPTGFQSSIFGVQSLRFEVGCYNKISFNEQEIDFHMQQVLISNPMS
jgi:hypothetical protein